MFNLVESILNSDRKFGTGLGGKEPTRLSNQLTAPQYDRPDNGGPASDDEPTNGWL